MRSIYNQKKGKDFYRDTLGYMEYDGMVFGKGKNSYVKLYDDLYDEEYDDDEIAYKISKTIT